MNQQLLNIYEFGPFRVDGTKRFLLREGQTVALTPKSFEMLLALVERSGDVVDKEGLMNRVWPDSFVEEGNLTYNISILRKALCERAGEHQYIVTVPGRGYQFVASVRVVSPDSSMEAAREQPEFSNGIDRKEPAPEPGDTRAQQQQGTWANQVRDARHSSRVTVLTRVSDRVVANIRRHKLILIAPVLIVLALISARKLPIRHAHPKLEMHCWVALTLNLTLT